MERKAFLRIDDFPYSGEMYAKYGEFRDSWMLRRLKKVLSACKTNGVVPEVMVSSHAVERNETYIRFDKVMPRTVKELKECFEKKLININAHGMTHLVVQKYLGSGVVDPQEFVGLSERDTRSHLEENIKFIKEVFGKMPRGFVAPAWGYEHGVTKKIASEYFDYIADSYDHWKEKKCLDFGARDSEYGFIHFPETWRYGKYSFQRSEKKTWETAWSENQMIHFIQHGYIIPGEIKATIKSLSFRRIIELPFKANLSSILRTGSKAGAVWETLENYAQAILGSNKK